MAIIKAKQKEYHARVPNETARDKNLSLKAKGLLCVLLSLDEDWKIYKTQISDFSSDKRDSTLSAFNELVEKGYIIDKGRARNEKGYLAESIYEVHAEKVRLNENKPIPDFPTLDNPTLDNPSLSNTIIIDNNSSKNIEKENKEVNLNINVDSKKSTSKRKKEAHPAFKEMVDFFCKEYWPTYDFKGSRDGRQINEIIEQIETLFQKHNRVCDKDSIVSFFQSVINNLPKFYKYKNLTKINSGFSEIVAEIKMSTNGKQTLTRNQQAGEEARAFQERVRARAAGSNSSANT